MTELSKDILARFQVRKTKAQKTAFIERMKAAYPELTVEEGGFGSPRNLVIGNVDTAKAVFTAHYDTCARLPFPNFITPLNIPLYLLYQLLITLPLLALMFCAVYFITLWTGEFLIGYAAMWLVLAAFLWMMFGGPANQTTVNDNTSGVLTLCEILAAMTPAEREKAAFVFFDLEEAGMIGSSRFAKIHKKVMKQKLLVNFDCVSDGDHFLIVHSKKAHALCGPALETAFAPAAEKQVRLVRSSRAIYPSDQTQFPCGVGAAAFKHKKGIGLYMDKIHTKHDTVLDERNIAYLRDAARRLIALL